MESYRLALFVIALVAVFAPLLARLPASYRMPAVVAELLLGMLVGPHLLSWVNPDGLVGMLSDLGLTFLLFMVGMETNLGGLQDKTLSLAVGGWFLSFSVAMACAGAASAMGLIQVPPLLAAVALSTSAVGILASILKDKNALHGEFGKLLLSAAAMGELAPLVMLSLLIIPTHTTFLHTVFIVAFVGITFVIADMAIHARPSQLLEALSQTMQSSGQLPVRICIALQAFLVMLAGVFGLNVVIGAFAAGMVVGLAAKGEQGELLRHKLDAIGYGFLIPIFFIVAGMRFDVAALWADPLVPVQIVCLLALLILVRGAPVLLYKQRLAPAERLPFILYSAMGLPMIVIISEIGVSSGAMAPDKAAVLVGAGMISVLLFPLWAETLGKSAEVASPDQS